MITEILTFLLLYGTIPSVCEIHFRLIGGIDLRISRRFAALFRIGTAEYVVVHGLRQKGRGRRPSTPYLKIYDPQAAFNAAAKEVRQRWSGRQSGKHKHDCAPARVVAQGLLRRSQGKELTAHYLGIEDPSAAFETALRVLRGRVSSLTDLVPGMRYVDINHASAYHIDEMTFLRKLDSEWGMFDDTWGRHSFADLGVIPYEFAYNLTHVLSTFNPISRMRAYEVVAYQEEGHESFDKWYGVRGAIAGRLHSQAYRS